MITYRDSDRTYLELHAMRSIRVDLGPSITAAITA